MIMIMIFIIKEYFLCQIMIAAIMQWKYTVSLAIKWKWTKIIRINQPTNECCGSVCVGGGGDGWMDGWMDGLEDGRWHHMHTE